MVDAARLLESLPPPPPAIAARAAGTGRSPPHELGWRHDRWAGWPVDASAIRCAGTLVVDGPTVDDDPGLPGVKYDFRTRQFTREAIWYRFVVKHLRKHKQPYTDTCPCLRTSSPVAAPSCRRGVSTPGRRAESPVGRRRPGRRRSADRDRQDAPRQHGRSPSGPGWPTLVITPTIDLMNQQVRRAHPQLWRRRRAIGRWLLRYPAANRDDVRFGLSQHGPPGQPVWLHCL